MPGSLGSPIDSLPAGVPLKQMSFWEDQTSQESSDPLYPEAVELVRKQGRASISMLQRRLRVGYTRAARMIETMEEKGIVGPPEPSTGTREVLDYGPLAPPAGEE
jgi:S-DNA-T family DNA segregation ATPase FtsK/SpoIIIE